MYYVDYIEETVLDNLAQSHQELQVLLKTTGKQKMK